MNADAGVFGIHLPGDSLIHRTPVGVKMALVLLASILTLVARNPWVSGGALLVMGALLLATRLPARRCFPLAPQLLILLVLLGGYHLVTGNLAMTFVVPVNVLVCLYASRVLVLTTAGPDLLGALVTVLRPARVVGIDPERVGLAVMIMLRSIPHLLGAMQTVRDAARARGLHRNPFAMVAPVVVQAIAYAQATGDALVARGLGERESRPGRD